MQRDTFNEKAKKQQCGSLARQQVDWAEVIADRWGGDAEELLRSIPEQTEELYMHRGAFDSTRVFWGYALANLICAAIDSRKPGGRPDEYFKKAKDWALSAPSRDADLERVLSRMTADDVVAAGHFMFG